MQLNNDFYCFLSSLFPKAGLPSGVPASPLAALLRFWTREKQVSQFYLSFYKYILLQLQIKNICVFKLNVQPHGQEVIMLINLFLLFWFLQHVLAQPQTMWQFSVFWAHVYMHARTEPNWEAFFHCQSGAGIAVSIASAVIALFVKSTASSRTVGGTLLWVG